MSCDRGINDLYAAVMSGEAPFTIILITWALQLFIAAFDPLKADSVFSDCGLVGAFCVLAALRKAGF